MRQYLGTFCPVVRRTFDRLRRRWARPRASLPSETVGPITLDDGCVLQVPSDDKMPPVEQHVPLSLSPPCASANSTRVLLRGDGRDGFMPNGQTRERPGVDLGALPPQRAPMSSQETKDLEVLEAQQLGGSEFSAQHGILGQTQVGTKELTTYNFDHAPRFPVLGWPKYQMLLGDAGPGTHLTRLIFKMDECRNLPTETLFARQRGADPVLAASGEAGAAIVPQNELGLLKGQGEMECPLKDTGYDVNNLPARRIRDHPNRHWEVGIRLGP